MSPPGYRLPDALVATRPQPWWPRLLCWLRVHYRCHVREYHGFIGGVTYVYTCSRCQTRWVEYDER